MTDRRQGHAAGGPRGALMQAIIVNRFGGPEVMQVGEVAMPEPGPDELLVRVLAAGVGPWDAHLRGGGWTGSLPYIPGGEFAGTVVGETGTDAGFADGAPVYGYPGLTGPAPAARAAASPAGTAAASIRPGAPTGTGRRPPPRARGGGSAAAGGRPATARGNRSRPAPCQARR